MIESPDERSAMARAMSWVSRVTTVSVEMVVPCLAGRWLDKWAGTGALFTILGAAFGLSVGMWHLIQMTKDQTTKDLSGDGNSRK
ncbi:MAG: AtpZ/AtpI family protein [Planctomycetales bacterium]